MFLKKNQKLILKTRRQHQQWRYSHALIVNTKQNLHVF